MAGNKEELIDELSSLINSLHDAIHYFHWQGRGFEFECWKFVLDPSLLPDEKKQLMGAAYNLDEAKKMVEETKVISDKVNGWVSYESNAEDAQIRFVPMDIWLKNFEPIELPWRNYVSLASLKEILKLYPNG